MSHQEQHFAGIHYRGRFVPGMTFNDYDYHATPIAYAHAPRPTQPKYCPACDSAMLIYQNYPVEKQVRTIWRCKQCNRLFVFISTGNR